VSNQHVKRLKQVRLEREAAQEALDKSASHAQHNPSFYYADFQDLRRAADNIGKTYYYRLTAELEGMLFRHLKDYYPGFEFDSKDGASDLVNYCRNQITPQKADFIPNNLADDVLDAIRWRNYLVHGEKNLPPKRVSFNDAFQSVHDMILLLPEMKGGHDWLVKQPWS
jgi:hypothetical protein